MYVHFQARKVGMVPGLELLWGPFLMHLVALGKILEGSLSVYSALWEPNHLMQSARDVLSIDMRVSYLIFSLLSCLTHVAR